MKLQNKTALITGAAVGIGRTTALLFAKEGARLVLADMNIEKLESVKHELAKYTDEVFCEVTPTLRAMADYCKENGI